MTEEMSMETFIVWWLRAHVLGLRIWLTAYETQCRLRELKGKGDGKT